MLCARLPHMELCSPRFVTPHGGSECPYQQQSCVPLLSADAFCRHYSQAAVPLFEGHVSRGFPHLKICEVGVGILPAGHTMPPRLLPRVMRDEELCRCSTV